MLPTGSGKSAIYELATALGGGPTVVVSPLLALQRDQIEKIEQEEIGSAAVLNSTLSETKREELLDELDDNGLEYLFLAPEQFASEETLEKLREAKPKLLVFVDVQRYEGDTVVVLFDDHGYRTLALDLVLERGLLSPT